MPGLILTGYPAAGKTTVSKVLRERALQQPTIEDVVIINEESACPDWTKEECYATSLAEKKTRAALKAAFDRAIATSNKKTLVVLDSLNYIKGFRYELHCLSKAAGERHGILWILNQASVVEEWNDDRPQDVKERESYSREQLHELILRYEPPDDRNRWDKPMFSVDVAPTSRNVLDSKCDAVKRSVYNMHALEQSLAVGTTSDVASDTRPHVESGTTSAATAGTKQPTKSAFSRAKRKPTTTAVSPAIETVAVSNDINATTQEESSSKVASTSAEASPSKSLEEQLDDILKAFLSSEELRQGASTQQHVAASANVLSEIDAITTRLVSAITTAQTLHTGGKLQVPLVQGRESTTTTSSYYAMSYPRMAGLPELRRLRRQYVQWVRTHPPDDTSEKGIAEAFIRYLEDQLRH